MEGLSLGATLQQHPDKMARPLLQTAVLLAARVEWNWDTKEAPPPPDSRVPLLWYLPTGTQAHAMQAAKGAFSPPNAPNTVLRSLQVGAGWVWWKGTGAGAGANTLPW